jgi:hypothetical protein
MKGVADAVELDVLVDEIEESGPVYAEDESVVVVAPMPSLIVFVLDDGRTDDKLVEYDELG